MKSKSIRHSVFALALAACSLTGAYANDQILNSDPINVSGYVSEPQATDRELEQVRNELHKQTQAIQVNKEKAKTYNKLGRSTEKLADATENLIEERKESQATIDKYNKKIACLMEENPGKDCDEYVKRKDSVSIAQAAPMNSNLVVVEDNGPSLLTGKIKAIPYVGYTGFQSENENLEASLSMGVRVEADITSRLSVGMGFNYTSMQTLDGANQFGNQFGNQYYNNFGQNGREIDYSNYNFDITGKFFITSTSRLRPYVGAGLGFNRTTMKYNDSNGYFDSNFNNQFGDEELVTSNINMQLLLGSEVVITRSIGANLEFGYKRGIGSGFNTNKQQANSLDQQRLSNLNDELASANIFSINAGMVVYF